MDPIIPPPDVRNVIDKTIPFIRQGGESTSSRLLISKPALFGFLNPSDPYFPWYQQRLTQTLEPEQKEEEIEPEPELEELLFSEPQPLISSKDLQIIKLVALYTSQDASFLGQLEAKVPTNQKHKSQFAFLEQDHTLRPLFDAFVRQYGYAANPPDAVKQRLEQPDVLKRALKRAEALALEKQQQRAKAEEQEAERIAYSQIDWQDFVIVETIAFESEDILEAPSSKEDVTVKRLVEPESSKPATAFKSPYTGEMIPASQFDEHMRIMNLDPTWKQQKDLTEQRQASTNLDTMRAAENLKRFASASREGPRKRHK